MEEILKNNLLNSGSFEIKILESESSYYVFICIYILQV